MPQNLTPTERLLAIADRQALSANEQMVLLAGLEFNAAPNTPMSLRDFDVYMDVVEEELAARPSTPPKEPVLPPTDMTSGDGTATLKTFFDRNLARCSLSKLVRLPIDGPAFERIGYDAVRLIVPKAEMATYRDILGRGLNFEAAEGDIVAGWYTIFADGSTAAIAITNAKLVNGGAYVDPFLILPDGVHPTVPNISLPPVRSLEEDFVFSYPDGTYKVVRLTPSTV